MFFSLSPNINENKVFIRSWGEIDGRIDPLFYSSHVFGIINKIVFDKIRIKEAVQYAKTGFAAGKDQQTEVKVDSIIQIRPTNMDNNGHLKFDKNIYVKEPKPSDLLVAGEILFNNTNSQELIGKTSIFNNIVGKYCCSNHITRLGVNSKIVIGEYLKEIFNFYQRKKIFYSICTNWNNQSGINNSVLEKISIPLPSKEIQKMIVDTMDNAYIIKQKNEKEASELLDNINDYLLGELGIVMPEIEENLLENRISYVSSINVIGGRFDPKNYATKYSNIFNAIKSSSYDKRSLKQVIKRNITGSWGLDESVDDEGLIKCLTIRATEFDNRYNLKLDNNRVKYRKYPPSIYEKMGITVGDILIEKSGGSEDQPVGRVALIENECVENNVLAFSNFIHKIVVNDDYVRYDYLYEYLTLMYNIKVTEVMQNQTNGIRNLIMGEYFEQTVLLPDKDKQKEIAIHIQQIREKAKRLEEEAVEEIDKAKIRVEKILLGEI